MKEQRSNIDEFSVAIYIALNLIVIVPLSVIMMNQMALSDAVSNVCG